MMMGYATNETDVMMPLSHFLATRLCMRMAECRHKKILPWIHPDAKSQVTVEYTKEGNSLVPVRVHTVLISTSHSDKVTLE
jgi:S-adenosylmethionine synthetase